MVQNKELTDHNRIELLAFSLQEATFQFKTLQEGQVLAHFLSFNFSNPNLAAFGILEILINAVEHGNLGIHYEEKTILQQTGKWLAEVDRRLNLPENIHKYVTVTFKKTLENIYLTVIDQGEGFNWKKFEEVDANRKFDKHGRGIAIAKSLIFQTLQYSEKGNEVLCISHIGQKNDSETPL